MRHLRRDFPQIILDITADILLLTPFELTEVTAKYQVPTDSD